MELESLEKLRNGVGGKFTDEGHFATLRATKFLEYIDAIQAEVDERYMPLPVDAEGVPIRIGDEIEDEDCRRYVIQSIGEDGFVYVYDEHKNLMGLDAGSGLLRHVGMRTVEDVLGDVIDFCFNAKKQGFNALFVKESGNLRDFAAELQMRDGE